MRTSPWRPLICLALLLALLSWQPSALSHSHHVHPDLTELSCELSGVDLWVGTYLNSTRPWSPDKDLIVLGSKHEDLKGVFRYRDHLYNPHTRVPGSVSIPGILPAVTAVAAARNRWEMMQYGFESENTLLRWSYDGGAIGDVDNSLSPNGTMHALGRVLHLLQDMGAPPHVHPPQGHGWAYHWGPGGGAVPFYSDFEIKWDPDNSNYTGWTFDITGGPMTPEQAITASFPNSRLDSRSMTALRQKLTAIPVAERNSIEGYMKSLAWISYYHSSFYGEIRKDQDSPAPQTTAGTNILASMYPDRISYTPGTIWNAWDSYWTIDGIGHYGKRLNFDGWWPCPGSYPEGHSKTNERIRGRFYIYWQNYATLSMSPVPPTNFPDGTRNSQNKPLGRYYGEVLLPLSVQFGAALIQEVFPAPVLLTYPAESVSGQFNVSWGAPPATPAGSPVGYKLERSGDAGATWESVYVGSATTHSEQVPLGNYRYRVRAQWFDSDPWGALPAPIFGVAQEGGECQVTLPLLTVRSSEDSTGWVRVTSTTRHGGTTTYAMRVPYDTEVQLEAPEYIGSGPQRKRFDRWSGALTSLSRVITLTMDGHKTLTAHYVSDPEPTFTLTVRASDGTAISGVAITSLTGHGGSTNYTIHQLQNETRVQLQAPQWIGSGEGRKRFNNWSGAVSSPNPVIAFNIDGNKTVTANYVSAPELAYYTLTVKAVLNNIDQTQINVPITGDYPGTTKYTVQVVQGGTVRLTAPESSGGYNFAAWYYPDGSSTKSREIQFIINENTTMKVNYTN